MSYIFTIEEQGTHTAFSGDFTNEDLINSGNEISQLPHFSNIKYQIVDFNNVNAFPVETHAIIAVAEQDAELFKINPNIKVAIIATKQVIKGLTNMYHTYAEIAGNNVAWEVKNFETEDDARKWVNS